MRKLLLVAATIILLTVLGYVVFPGHTFLYSDSQIYVPILERYQDPTLFTRDLVALTPHVSFTIYDEATLALRRLTGLDLQAVLGFQQLLFRALGILGVFLIAASMGLSRRMSMVVAAIYGLGASIPGPTVLTIEYEPVPRGFAVPLLLLAAGLVAQGRDLWAGIAAALAFLYHPPSVYNFWGLYFLLTLWPNKPTVMGRRIWGLLPMLCAVVALLFLSRLQPGVSETQPFFSRISPELEKLQRMRAPYVWVSVWPGFWYAHYIFLWLVSLAAFWRVRKSVPEDLKPFLVGLPFLGVLSLPLSYLLLEKLNWIITPQIQPLRAVLFITLFAGVLASIAGVKAAEVRRRTESAVWFLIAFAIPIHTRVLEILPPDFRQPLLLRRAALAAGLACVAALTAWAVSRQKRWATGAVAALVLAPLFLIPRWGKVVNYAELRTPGLTELCNWARTNTAKDAIFHFPDAGRAFCPGVFRASALRAVYVDWKAGGQVNFLPHLGLEWWQRWSTTMDGKFRADRIPLYLSLGIDYVVVRSKNRRADRVPVFENAESAVYALRKPGTTAGSLQMTYRVERNSSTSRRAGTDACAPRRVTLIAAEALAKRNASSTGFPSANATANPALNVSPAAVVSRAST